MLDGTGSVDAAETVALRRALLRFAADASVDVEHISSLEVDEALRFYEMELDAVLSTTTSGSSALVGGGVVVPVLPVASRQVSWSAAGTAAAMVASMLSKTMRLTPTEASVAALVHHHLDVGLLYGVAGVTRLLETCGAHVPDAAFITNTLAAIQDKLVCQPTRLQQQPDGSTGQDGFLSARQGMRGSTAAGNLTARRRSTAGGNVLRSSHEQNLSARHMTARGSQASQPTPSSGERAKSIGSPLSSSGLRTARGSVADRDGASAATKSVLPPSVNEMFVSLPIFLECLSAIKRRQFEEVIRQSDVLAEQSLRDAIHSIAEATAAANGNHDDDHASTADASMGASSSNVGASGGGDEGCRLSEDRIEHFLQRVFGVSLFQVGNGHRGGSEGGHDEVPLLASESSGAVVVSRSTVLVDGDVEAATFDAGQLLLHLNTGKRSPLAVQHRQCGPNASSEGRDGGKAAASSFRQGTTAAAPLGATTTATVNALETRSGGSVALPRLELTRDVECGAAEASPKGQGTHGCFDARSPYASGQTTSRGSGRSPTSSRVPSSSAEPAAIAVAPTALVPIPTSKGGNDVVVPQRVPSIMMARGEGGRTFTVFVDDDDADYSIRRADNGSPCGGGWSSNSSVVVAPLVPDVPMARGSPKPSTGSAVWRQSNGTNAAAVAPSSRQSSAPDMSALRRASMLRRQQYTHQLQALTHDILEKKLRQLDRSAVRSASTQGMRKTLSTVHAARRTLSSSGSNQCNALVTSASTSNYPRLGGLALCPALYRLHGNDNIYARGLAAGADGPSCGSTNQQKRQPQRSASASPQHQRQTPMRCASASIRGPQLAMQIRQQASVKLEALATQLQSLV